MCLAYSEPFFLIGFRMTLAGFIIIFVIYFYDNKQLKIKRSHYILFFFLTLFNIYLTNSFEILGLCQMASSKACLIYSVSPFITAFIAFFLLNEKLDKKKIIGMIIGFLGLVPISFYKTIDEIKLNNIYIFSVAEIYLIIAVISSVFGWVFLKKILQLGYSFFQANGISMFIGGLFILLNSLLFKENWTPIPVTNLWSFMFFTLITCIISNIICYNLFAYLLKYFSTTFMTFSGLMTPFFAVFWGFIFLDESITYHFFLSMFIFIIGLFIFFLQEKS